MKLPATAAAALAIVVAGISVGASGAASDPVAEPPAGTVIAIFEGERFDMADGWGTPDVRPEIGACHVAADGTATCYRTEQQLNARLMRSQPSNGATSQRAATCSASLRLYDGTSFNAPLISINQRYTLVSLSWYGFSNRTSSYKVGACSATLFDGIGSGVYPGNTNAWASAASMWPGWSNRISSVQLN